MRKCKIQPNMYVLTGSYDLNTNVCSYLRGFPGEVNNPESYRGQSSDDSIGIRDGNIRYSKKDQYPGAIYITYEQFQKLIAELTEPVVINAYEIY